MISIRLSEDEYSALVNLCATTGARSISDLARDAMRLLTSGSNEEHLSRFHADGLQAQIELLNQRIEELNGRILASQDWDGGGKREPAAKHSSGNSDGGVQLGRTVYEDR